MLKLHTYEMDEDCYRARLLLSFLGIEFLPIAVDMFPGQEHLGPDLRALSPTGRMPVLEKQGMIVSGAVAALCFIARAYDPAGDWLPNEPGLFGEAMHWLSFSETVLAHAREARLAAIFDTAGEKEKLVSKARLALRIMDDHMTIRQIGGESWFVGGSPTIADIALFPSFALSRDFGVDHEEYPALRKWSRKFRKIDGFITMPGIPDYG